jgi:hypothetical protein
MNIVVIDTVEHNEEDETLGEDDIKNRLAAAEYDIKVIAKYAREGSHPSLTGA